MNQKKNSLVCQEMVEWLLQETENLEIRKMGKINIQSRDLVTALHMCFVKQIGKRLANL